MKKFIVALVCFALVAGTSFGAISIADFNQYNENFNGMGADGVATPNAGTTAGWVWYTSTTPTPTTVVTPNNGTSVEGGYNYGTTGDGDRAFGVHAGGGADYYLQVNYVNNTGADINGFTISYRYEQWEGNEAGATETNPWQVQIGAGSWTPTGYSVSQPSPSTTGQSDGNAAGYFSNQSHAISTGTISPGTTFSIRMFDVNDAPNDCGVAIDDWSFQASAIPEPSTMALFGIGTLVLVARRIRRK